MVAALFCRMNPSRIAANGQGMLWQEQSIYTGASLITIDNSGRQIRLKKAHVLS